MYPRMICVSLSKRLDQQRRDVGCKPPENGADNDLCKHTNRYSAPCEALSLDCTDIFILGLIREPVNRRCEGKKEETKFLPEK